MTNTDIFQDFDLVVAITQATINSEFSKLTQDGTIPAELIIYRVEQDGNYVYTMVDSADDIPDDTEYIDASILAQIDIRESGTNVVLLLQLQSGSAAFYTSGAGPLATLTTYTVENWQYGITIDIGQAKIGDENKIVVSDAVSTQLDQLESDQFEVQYLYMVLDNVDFTKPESEDTSTGDAGEEALSAFTLFMADYLDYQKDNGNPYIFGYNAFVTDDTNTSSDDDVPANLQPSETTFNVYYDSDNNDLSTLNYIMVTEGGHGTITTQAGAFDSNWITDDQYQGRIILADAIYTEYYILKPIFDQIRQGIYDQIKNVVNNSIGNDYDDAVSKTDSGYAYVISDDTSGNNQYSNTYTADMGSADGAGTVTFNGYIRVKKTESKEIGTCKAKAWALEEITWTGTVTVGIATDQSSGYNVLQMSSSFPANTPRKKNDKNDCAREWDSIADFFDSFFDLLGDFGEDDFWGDFFENIFSVSYEGIGDIEVITGNFSSVMRTTVILPAGGVYDYQDVDFDDEGNLYSYLDYKS